MSMLRADDPAVQELLLKGNFGLEKESLRVDERGYLAHTMHPFPLDDKNIVRDFCENQTEINTGVNSSPEAAVKELEYHYSRIQKGLAALEPREYLWPFSNPPYIINEADVPVAQFEGDMAAKTEYRNYLSDRYGRYKMTFSGIHFNFSFSDELLQAGFAASKETDYDKFRNDLYVGLAERASEYCWLMISATAASPLMDGTFVEKGSYDKDEFNGMASVRCSELGYWNFFAPILDFSSVEAYADSIQRYVDMGLIKAPSELYYPIRLKPRGENNLETLKEKGVNHIELRMIDLNPLVPGGIEVKDVKFAHLMLVWLASTPRQPYAAKDQVQAVQNFKNAAHYDLKTVKIVVPNGEVYTVAHAALNVLGFMKDFYQEIYGRDERYADTYQEIMDVLKFQEDKFTDPDRNRYAWLIRNQFCGSFVQKGMELAKKRQEEAVSSSMNA